MFMKHVVSESNSTLCTFYFFTELIHAMMVFDITVEGFDQDYFPLHLSVEGDVNLDDLMVIVADKCGISPAARTLFAFQQVTHKYYNQSEKLIIHLAGK